MEIAVFVTKLCVQLVLTGEASGEEGQQDGVQGGEGAAGEADVEPENKRSGPEALVAGRDSKTSDGTEPEPGFSSSVSSVTVTSRTFILQPLSDGWVPHQNTDVKNPPQTVCSPLEWPLKEKYGVFAACYFPPAGDRLTRLRQARPAGPQSRRGRGDYVRDYV